jgi:gliding motility-associated-like protein
MKNTLLIFFLICVCFDGQSQIISVNDATMPESLFSLEQLVEEVLIDNACDAVSGFEVRAAGLPSDNQIKSYGYFKTPEGSNFPFAEGIVLTTGSAFMGGNVLTFPSQQNFLPGDEDLELALDVTDTFDATYVTFEFVPTRAQLSFRYLMTSVEYQGDIEFISPFECDYTDGFAFLLREVGSTDYTNLAVLPDGTPVNVTNINNSVPCPANTDYFEGYNLGDTNYSGRTVVLTASATVIPFQPYEIKLVVADQLDDILDSAIFIEGGSFNLGLDLGEYLTVCNDEPAILDTHVDIDDATFQWFFNGDEIVGQTDNTLEVTEDGEYLVIIQYSEDCITTDAVLVEFIENPEANPINDQLICDDDGDGFWALDLTAFNDEVLGGQDPSKFTISYYDSQDAADTGNEPLSSPYTNTEASKTIVARIESAGNQECYDTTDFLFEVYDTPIANPVPDPFVCDDDDDAFWFFNLTNLNETVLGTQDPDVYKVTYYDNLDDANQGINPLPSIYIKFNNYQEVFARVDNDNSPGNICYAITGFTLNVLSPVLVLDDSYILCRNTNGTEVIGPPLLDTGLSELSYSFEWELEEELIVGANGASYPADEEGTYTVHVIHNATGCQIEDSTEVIYSSPPVLTASVTSMAFADLHIIEAIAEGDGIYEFSLDNGPWQDGGTFENVTWGPHIVTARDINGCGLDSTEVMVIDYPYYFTPNADGYNDSWNVIGMDAQQDANIYIFDRYGKLLKNMIPTDLGWNGTYNGKKLPSSDYWFLIEYDEPNDGLRKQFRGHFTLKR